MAGLQLDLVSWPVNINWGGGLAVEFTEEPSYLTLDREVNMNKVIISFWFRVPQEVMDKVRAATPGFFTDARVMVGVVPLITWGEQQTAPFTPIEEFDTGSITDAGQHITLERLGDAHTVPTAPSYIGLRTYPVGGDESSSTYLDVHIQTSDHATASGLAKMRTGFTGDLVLGTGEVPIYINVEYTHTDVSHTMTQQPDYLGNSDAYSSESGANHPEVTAGKWHHLLISWELLAHSSGEGEGGATMWCAIDDENKDGDDLPAMNSGLGANNHMAYVPYFARGKEEALASISFSEIPSEPLKIPAHISVDSADGEKNPIETIEMAELQIFSGLTLDTSSEANRRAFIDFKRDENGNPVVDEDGKNTLKPVDPKKAEELLGQKPDVLLHGTTKWQKGKNTGSLGRDNDGNAIPSGQFVPVGDINKYKPDPTIVK